MPLPIESVPTVDRRISSPDGFALTDAANASAHNWNERVVEISSFRELEIDWDGQGSEAPSLDVDDAAAALAERLHAERYRPADRVLAGVNGTIFFEWNSSDRFLEVDVLDGETAEVRSVRKDVNVVAKSTWKRQS